MNNTTTSSSWFISPETYHTFIFSQPYIPFSQPFFRIFIPQSYGREKNPENQTLNLIESETQSLCCGGPLVFALRRTVFVTGVTWVPVVLLASCYLLFAAAASCFWVVLAVSSALFLLVPSLFVNRHVSNKMCRISHECRLEKLDKYKRDLFLLIFFV